jgi:hypothetical protein
MAKSSTRSQEALVARRELERKRDCLLGRLHDRAGDVAATKELQNVSNALAESDVEVDDDRPHRLRTAGLSFFDRLRQRWKKGETRAR